MRLVIAAAFPLFILFWQKEGKDGLKDCESEREWGIWGRVWIQEVILEDLGGGGVLVSFSNVHAGKVSDVILSLDITFYSFTGFYRFTAETIYS